jgi:hypothetical protein
LFNGSFEVAPSGVPFDWSIESGAGVTVDLVPLPELPGKHALSIEFGYGRVEFGGITQLVLLSPGTYYLSGKYRGRIKGKRGLVWRITCADDNGAPIGESPLFNGEASTWREFKFTFTVAETGCLAQRLRLLLDARSPSEHLVSGSVWYAELRISRLGEQRRHGVSPRSL